VSGLRVGPWLSAGFICSRHLQGQQSQALASWLATVCGGDLLYDGLIESRLVSDPLEDELPPEPKRSIIGQVTYHLDHLANMLHCIDEYWYSNHHLRIACTDSFLLDFRALYYFLLGNRQGTDANRLDFLGIKVWQPKKKTAAARRMARLADFVSKHRAHRSMSRFDPPYPDLEQVVGVRRLTAEFLGRVLLDYLDVLDDFIDHLPDSKESGKRAWTGAAGNARYKTETALGLRESDFPDSFKPLKSVAARKEAESS
jgi:hypothetical protein